MSLKNLHTILIALIGVSMLWAGSGPQALHKEWETRLGDARRGVIYRVAVCPDGAVYVTESTGRVMMVSADGKALFDTHVTGLPPVTTAACDARERLYIGGGNAVSVLEPAPDGQMHKVSSFRTDFHPIRLLLAGPDDLFALGPGTGIYRLSKSGKKISRFGANPTARTAKAARSFAQDGALLWDPAKRQVLFIPRNPYGVQIYALDGRIVSVKPVAGTNLHPPRLDPASGRPLPNRSDMVFNAARLPDGTLVTEVLRRREDGSTNASVEVLDTDFRIVSSGIPVAYTYGLLAGADDDGVLYFSKIGPPGVSIVRARLVAEP